MKKEESMKTLKDTELKSQEENYNQQEYNDIPVHYCTECLSLKVRYLKDEGNYCDHCHSTDTKEAHIHDWEKMYQEKYGKKFINNNKK